jgi:hypothetical protein
MKMKIFALLFSLLALPGVSWSLQRPTEFAGISTTASVQALMASGFTCMPSTRSMNETRCINDVVPGTVYGVSFRAREAIFINGNLIFVSIYSQPSDSPAIQIQSLVAALDSQFKRTTFPRFLEMSDNQSRVFWRAFAVHTVSVSTVPIQDSTGKYVVRFSMFMPVAH